MPTNELESFMRAIVEGLSLSTTPGNTTSITAPAGGGAVLDRATSEPSAADDAIGRILQPMRPQSAPIREATVDAGRLAAEVELLRMVVNQHTTAQPAATVASRVTNVNTGGSAVESVLKTLGMATGIGPLATGLMTLFGSKSTEEPVPTAAFEPPAPIAVEAGLTSDRQFARTSYGADGVPRAATSGGNTSAGAVPPIQINVQAMDSRSFLDHSDDIARAVREAMLHSHALNDVVSEL
jgi:hypothetical protein